MTLEQIDEELAEWKTKLQSAGDNLLALTQMSAYQRLRGEGGWPKPCLGGVTAERVGPALDGMNGLWSHYAALTGVIQRAQQLRASVTWLMPSPKVLVEIGHLLHGESVELSAVETPLSQRGLLTAGEVVRRRTPEQLLAEMTQAFQRAKDVVVAVDRTWDRLLPLLEGYDKDIAELEGLAGSVGEAAGPELAQARQHLAALRARVDEDPLGVSGEAATVASALDVVRSRLGKLARERDDVRARLGDARGVLRELEEAHRSAREAHAEREQKVQVDDAARLPRPLEDAEVAALAPWLDRLEGTAEQGRWQAAGVGLGKWLGIARQYIAAEQATRAANEAAVRARRDLRGLLDALRAKAQACGRSEDAELAALGQEAWQLLHSRPTPLARAQRLVAEYESRLL
jgi:hypothetical protein